VVNLLSALDELIASILKSARYRSVCPETVRRIGERELAKGRGLKAAVKATRSRLHQVFGAFGEAPDYGRLLRDLAAAAASGSAEAVREACRAALACHASTRERLPILDRFYAEVFAITGVPSRVLDLACGLHPLALPWMGLGAGDADRSDRSDWSDRSDRAYRAYDIDGRAVEFLGRCAALIDPALEAIHADILCSPPTEEADVAFLLKTLPCLERQEKGGGRRVLDAIRARHIVVSFPVASLGGREKGMRANYEKTFLEMFAGGPWQVERLEFPTELVFVVRREDVTANRANLRE